MPLLTTLRRRLAALGDNPWLVMALCVIGLVAFFSYVVVNARNGGSVNGGVSASVVGGLSVLFVVTAQSVLFGRSSRGTAEPLHRLHAALEAELRRLPGQRGTGADNDSLQAVIRELELADRELAQREEASGARRLQTLGRLTDGWAQGSPERAAALGLVDLGDRIVRLDRRNRRLGRRRGSSDSRTDHRGASASVDRPSTAHPSVPEVDPEERARGLVEAERYPEVMALVEAGDVIGAAKAYRAATSVGLADAHAAVMVAARRRGLPGSDR